MLIDQDLAHDRRVRVAVEAYRRRGFPVDVVDIRRAGCDGGEREAPAERARRIARCVGFVITRVLPAACRHLRAFLRVVREERALSYELYATWKYIALAVKETVRIYHRGLRWFSRPRRHYALIHANDLRCLIFAAAAKSLADPVVLYDSHELNLFRNRTKSSVVRLAINFLFEGAAIGMAAQVVVVSEPIGTLLLSLYGHPRIAVVPNALYGDAAPISLRPGPRAAAAADGRRLAVVFFGGVNTGRGLGHLDRLSRECTDVGVHLVLFGGEFEARAALDVLLGPARDRRFEARFAGPDPRTLDLGASFDAVFSWCVIEDVCLSYRLALPNKLFQSVAMRMPVITLAGTHVDRYAREHGIGVSLSPDEIPCPRRVLTRLTGALADYEAMRVRMQALQVSLDRQPPGERFARIAQQLIARQSGPSGRLEASGRTSRAGASTLSGTTPSG